MKKILFVCLMAALGLGTGSAAAKDAKKASTVTTVFKTDIDCEHCAKRIMDNIPFEKGVKDVKVDVPSKEVTVVYDASKNDAEGLVKGFAKIRVKAEACDAKCCQGTACKENCCQKAACKENCIIHKTNRCAFKKTKRCVLGKINFVSCIYRICNT